MNLLQTLLAPGPHEVKTFLVVQTMFYLTTFLGRLNGILCEISKFRSA